jgi:hypothetical protein
MGFLKHFYTDDKSNQYSDTTLRAWLLFALFFFFGLALAVAMMFAAFRPDVFQSPGKIEGALALLEMFGYAYAAAGGLYLGKRINERSQPVVAPDDYQPRRYGREREGRMMHDMEDK